MRIARTWTLPENVIDAGDELSVVEFCANCGDITYHQATYVRTHPLFGKKLIAMLWCRTCGYLHFAHIGDVVPPLPDGFHISDDGRVVRRVT